MPNPNLPDSVNGVFPMPYHPTSNPEGGIRDTACEGMGYEFVLTAIVGDLFTVGTTTLPLDSLWLDKNTAVQGLPDGLGFSCFPENCVFKRDTRGCVRIHGTPKTGTDGVHQLKISGKLFANGSSFGLPLSFPDPNIAPGEYALVVAKANESPCVLGIGQGANNIGIDIYPNPFGELVQVELGRAARVSLYDLTGQVLYQENLPAGLSAVQLGPFPAGLYLLKAETDRGVIGRIINKL